MSTKVKITEGHIQMVVMYWAMIQHTHEIILPNSNQFFGWEADLISITRAGVIHEYEIKLNKYDYKADFKKKKWDYFYKATNSPSYFWYVTYDFEIEPPEHAGWLLVTQRVSDLNSRNPLAWNIEEKLAWNIEEKKKAPKLNRRMVDEKQMKRLAKMLSWRVYHGLRDRLQIIHSMNRKR